MFITLVPLLTLAVCAGAAGKNHWAAISSTPDPTASMLREFRSFKPLSGSELAPTGISRGDYLKFIAGEVDFWKTYQDKRGAVIDPYSRAEIQYSTPAFAHAAAALVVWGGRDDLLAPASKALDWSLKSLSQRKAASGHEDFYPPMIAHAMRLLKPRVESSRYRSWETSAKSINPRRIYRMSPGSMNWNIVSSCGEDLFRRMGLRADNRYVEASFAAQGRHFVSPFGLYCEGPMAYDLFPRVFLEDVLASGYDGDNQDELETMMNRAAITSLFMQSPWGELPSGGRSAHHQWNEAQQAAVYEIRGAKALRDGDLQLAGIYKRAAHLALRSMRRWVRPSGEMQIIKNWIDPRERFAYEKYSHHSQYNLLPMSMLATAYEHAASTDQIPERPAPADLGGFVFEIPELHKIFANAGGTYVEIETVADPHYDATGLVRIHFRGVSPQLGISDSVLAHPSYQMPGELRPPANTGMGVAWQDGNGNWRRLGEFGVKEIRKTTLSVARRSQEAVEFAVTYEGHMAGVARIQEIYRITLGAVELASKVEGIAGKSRYVWPVLADDGRTTSQITVEGKAVSVSQDGGATAVAFSAPAAGDLTVGSDRYPNHNGFIRLAQAEFPAGETPALVVKPRWANDE